MNEFKPWRTIKRLDRSMWCIITEKLHGSSAQILIEEVSINHPTDYCDITTETNYRILAGSRNRWLSPGKETDNYGFAQWVEDNKQELIEKLGTGTHYGEWYGVGINKGYNLKERHLALFNTEIFLKEDGISMTPPQNVEVVPVLYKGVYSQEAVDRCMEKLKNEGSVMQPGFMKPEGIVIEFPAFGHSAKLVFDDEETSWKKGKNKPVKEHQGCMDVSKYLQPIRLEKLLSRDSRYMENYPSSLVDITKDYYSDLEKEDQLIDADDATKKFIKQALFPWIKGEIK